jgi:hypothetical protein
MNFPDTVMDFDNGVNLYNNNSLVHFQSLQAPPNKVVLFSAAYEFLVGNTVIPAGHYFLTDQGLFPQNPSNICQIAKMFSDKQPSPDYEGLNIESILNAGGFSLTGQPDTTDFPRWLDRIPHVDPTSYEKASVIRGLTNLIAATLPMGAASDHLRLTALEQCMNIIDTHPMRSNRGPQYVHPKAIEPAMHSLRKIYNEVKAIPSETVRTIVGDTKATPDGPASDPVAYSYDPRTSSLRKVDYVDPKVAEVTANKTLMDRMKSESDVIMKERETELRQAPRPMWSEEEKKLHCNLKALQNEYNLIQRNCRTATEAYRSMNPQ